MPVMYQASQTGMKVMRYFSDPMRLKREADPMNKSPTDEYAEESRLCIRSFWDVFRRSLRSINYFRTAFISFNNTSIISLNEVN